MTTRTYYGQPVLKQPAWTVEVPWYLFAGGMAGASSLVVAAADTIGDQRLGRVAGRVAAAGAVASPILLILDLGRPARFLAMLRMFKVTSPLSVGSWVLAAYAPAALATAALGELGRWPTARRLATASAAATGSVITVYTGVLFADTAIPVWHRARRELPFVFASSSAASAGAAATLLGGAGRSGSAGVHRLTIVGSVAELVATRVMGRRLGDVGRPYHEGRSGRWARGAEALTATGALAMTLGRRSSIVTRLGAAAVLVGSLCQRFAVFTAGFASADDPAATIDPQRARAGGTPATNAARSVVT